jgi:ABC-type sugar transport system ATPase subunit
MISHNLNDVFEVADRIAVMYLGRLIVQGPVSQFNTQSVVEYMTTGTAGKATARDANSDKKSVDPPLTRNQSDESSARPAIVRT